MFERGVVVVGEVRGVIKYSTGGTRCGVGRRMLGSYSAVILKRLRQLLLLLGGKRGSNADDARRQRQQH